MVNDVTDTDPILTNGPDDDVELNTPYHAAPADAFHDTKMELDDLGVAVTPVGVAGGEGLDVVALAVFDGELVPTLLIADTR